MLSAPRGTRFPDQTGRRAEGQAKGRRGRRTCTAEAARGGQELPSIALSIPGAMEYLVADFMMAVPRHLALPSLPQVVARCVQKLMGAVCPRNLVRNLWHRPPDAEKGDIVHLHSALSESTNRFED